MEGKIEGRKVIGVKQTIKALKSGAAIRAYIARDAEERVTRPVEELCASLGIEVVFVDTMTELGRRCGIDVGAATAALVG
jgi:large subunit ribosomal protein L7A